MNKLDWFVIGLACGPLFFTAGSVALSIFNNAYKAWLKGKIK